MLNCHIQEMYIVNIRWSLDKSITQSNKKF